MVDEPKLGFSPRRAAGTALIALLAAPGCFTYFSYQSARSVERGDPQATLSVSRSGIVSEETDDSSWLAFEGLARFGVGLERNHWKPRVTKEQGR